jgi:SAM-dependent methyltransferase
MSDESRNDPGGPGESAGAAEAFACFRRSVPLRMRLQETLRALGACGGQTCLEIGSSNGALSHYLRRHGGEWYSAVWDQQAEESLQAVVRDHVVRLKDRTLPYKKKAFDAVVILDGLEGFEVDEAFIQECHRVLKPDGRLVVNVPHGKPGCVMRHVRALLNLIRPAPGLLRISYGESQLFSILKHGFDVLQVRSYSRFFVEFVDAVLAWRLAAAGVAEVTPRERSRALSVAGPFFWLANQLDLMLFLTRGHWLVAVAKRRAWRPRNAPILVDGRSISEVVLSRAAN